VAHGGKTPKVLVIVVPERVYLGDLVRQQFNPRETVEVIVDRRRRERRGARERLLVPEDRRTQERRQLNIRAELQATGWAIIRHATARPPDRTGPWQLPWLRIQLLLRMFVGRRWDVTVRPTAEAALREALAARRRIRQEGWFN
jgi:hypothetical protein